MAYDNPGSMYDDADQPPKPSPAEQTPDEEGKEGEQGEEKTYVLPKEILMGKDFKPGDEVVLKIKAIHDDRIEVAYAPAKEQEGKQEEGGEGEGAAPGGGGQGGQYAAMME
jgi:hypothetical protein